MAGRGDPPEGTPDGVPGGDDDFRDEYRSTVFDESFVEAARIQEYSAQERIEDEGHAAVRRRPPGGEGPYGTESGDTFFGERPDDYVDASGGAAKGRLQASKQGIVLVLLIALAFGTAIYMGIRNPYQGPAQPPTQPMRIELLPLAPRDVVPGGTAKDLYEHSQAAQFRTGGEGVTMPPARRTAHFSESQVLSALTLAKDYVIESSLDPEVIMGRDERPVRILLDPAQHKQFDRSLERPRADGRHAATGWMIRFDPAKVALADSAVRVNGTLTARESAGNSLEITADHVFVYAVRPAGDGKAAKGEQGSKTAKGGAEDEASLFTVRREIHFHFDQQDLREQQLSVGQVAMRAGPLTCSGDSTRTLTPLFAGEEAKDDGKAGNDPFARGRSSASMCGILATSAQPDPNESG